MKIKVLAVLASLTFVCQIAFSIYYSIKIVDENYLINSYQEKLIEVKSNHQILQNQFSEQNSLKYIKTFLPSRQLIPINSAINLTP